MYYSLGPSLFWIVVFVVGFFYLKGKINTLSERVDKLAKEGGVKTQSVSAPTPIPSAGVALSPTGEPTVPEQDALAVPVVPPLPKAKADSEETGSRWLGKIGVFAIVLGVSFFLKWAFDNNIIGPMGRIVLGILGGAVMVTIGQFLRKKYAGYSDIVSGGGIAVLYLSIFSAYAFYQFIGQGTAMILMLFITALSVTLSVIGGTQQLAVLGVVGGFVTPLLLSTGKNELVSLMSYLVILDLGVLGVAIFKKWGRLNLLGFIGTALLFFGWFARFYTQEQLALTFLFLTVFFLIYLVAGIVHNILWGKDSTSEELVLVTFVPAGYGLMSYVILDPQYHGIMGFFMLVLSLFYFAVAFVSYRINQNDKLLNLYLPGIAIIFLTVAMPLQFGGVWVTIAWLLEAGLLVLAGNLTRRHSMNVFAVLVYSAGLIRFFAFDANVRDIMSHTPIFNSKVFISLVAIGVAYLIGYMFVRHEGEDDSEGRRHAAIAFVVLANILSLYIVTSEINTSYDRTLYKSRQAFALVEKDYYGGGIERSPRQQAIFEQSRMTNYEKETATRNRRNTVVSIVWALYAVLLTAIGFTLQKRVVRVLGLILFFVTAFKVLIDVWALGQLYRIISSITFGVIALFVSFAYAKWKDRLKEVL